MSLYDKASLVQIPSGTKDGTLYSVLPANGDGDFTHTRATSATRVNKDGLIESVASGVPRLDYPLIDGVVQDCPALLLEPTRANSLTNSEDLNSWLKGSGITITTDDIIAPDGNNTADKIQKTSQNYTFVRQSFTAQTGVFSIFVKKGNHRYVGIRNNESNTISHSVFDFDTESFIVSQANRTLAFEKFPNGWYRLIDYVSVNDSNAFVGICISDSSGNEIGTSIPLNSYIYAWGGQRESGQTYPTSYIPTTSAAVTRNADECNGAGTSAEFNDSEGVLFAEISSLGAGSLRRFAIDNNASPINIVRLEYSSTTNKVFGVIYNGTSQIDLSFYVPNELEFNKVAFKYKSGDFALWVNGVEVDTSTSTFTMPTGLKTLGFDDGSGGNDFYSKTKQVVVFNQALTESELEQITSWTSFGEMAKGQLYTVY
jgi:hypothetical protein